MLLLMTTNTLTQKFLRRKTLQKLLEQKDLKKKLPIYLAKLDRKKCKKMAINAKRSAHKLDPCKESSKVM